MKNKNKKIILLVLVVLFLNACAYIVTPEPATTPTTEASKGWAGFVTNVGPSDTGSLRIEIGIQNDTSDWSVMQAAADKPVELINADGSESTCETVFVSTGGNSLPNGFQMRGYTGGTKMEPKTQLLYVECAGATAQPGQKLKVEYTYTTGSFNYYVKPKPVEAEMVLNLDEVAADVQYPVAKAVDGLINKETDTIEAINQCVLTLAGVTRTDTGLEFSWNNKNPSPSPTYVHIGMPPVIASDGIIYGFFESPHLADTPITPNGGESNWTTTVTAPADVTGLYLLVSVESKQQRNFINHVIDITDK